ncbi:hypothetical protein SDC9_66648 [bioreactor metagenome]|uniref:Uncharacterized protein n=1 Tax=bioreactor metagenome TaxID=1076179 RepID=A0A644XVV8_9ZZZZ
MKDYELIDIDQNSLPDVSLSQEQINKIKATITFHLSMCIESIKDLDIDYSFKNIISVYDSLGKERDLTIHGVKYAKVFEKLIIPAFDKKYSPSDENLIFKYFGSPGSFVSNWSPLWSDILHYCQIYITKTHLIIYYFNYIFKMVKSYKIPIKEVKNVSFKKTINDLYWNITDEYLKIDIKSTNDTFPRDINLVVKKNNLESLNNLKNSLVSLGVSNNIYHRNKIFKYYGYFIFMITLLIILYMVWLNF